MSPNQIRGAYVLYIGAGAVAAGGVVSLARALPMIWRSLRGSLGGYGAGSAGKTGGAQIGPRGEASMLRSGMNGLRALTRLLIVLPVHFYQVVIGPMLPHGRVDALTGVPR